MPRNKLFFVWPILLALFLFVLPSCRTVPSADVTPAGEESFRNTEYFYFLAQVTDHLSVMKCDTKGTISYACPDPLCAHDKSCPLCSAASQLCAGDRYLLFDSLCGVKPEDDPYSLGASAVWIFDLQTQELSHVFSFDQEQMGYVSGLQISGNQGYISVDSYEMVKDPKTETEQLQNVGYRLYRFDPAAEKLSLLTDKPTSGEYTLLEADGERLYWSYQDPYTSDADELFSTDIYFGQRQSLAQKDRPISSFPFREDGWYYYMDSEKLWRINRETEEKQLLQDPAFGFCLAKNRIVYLAEPRASVLRGMCADGTEQTVLCDTEGSRIFFLRSRSIGNYVLNDQYVMVTENGTSLSYLLIDTETWKWVSIPAFLDQNLQEAEPTA